MQNNELQTIKNIISQLDKLNHPDSYRIAKEIYTFAKGDIEEINNIILRISSNEPWEYIKGNVDFLGNEFKVTSSTLIPRIETEELVKIALQIVTENHIKHVVDVGTGSGAIILSLAKSLNSVNFTATDISENALDIAESNARRLDLQASVNFVHTNLLENVKGVNSDTLVVANLPYIPTNLYRRLHPSVKDYEPQVALEGGNDGVKYIKELFLQIQKLKDKPKYILLEIDPSIVSTLTSICKDLMSEYFLFIQKDFRNLDRFALLTIV